jgi:hypothetical protein
MPATTRERSRRSVFVSAIALTLLLAGCSGSPEPNASGTPSAPAPSTGPTSSPTSSAGASAASSACPSAGTAPPADAATAPTVDVDGDGRADTVWIAGTGGHRRLGITTATGVSFDAPITSGSPVPAAALVVNADERGPVEVLLSDGRTVDLLVVEHCRLTPVIGADGSPYRFDLGFRGTGTGIGCLDLDHDGRRDLVGLNAIVGADGQVHRITRTAIDLHDAHAANGAHDELRVDPAKDRAAIRTAQAVTCGDLTRADDGVHERRG